jgi:hypothetical protein
MTPMDLKEKRNGTDRTPAGSVPDCPVPPPSSSPVWLTGFSSGGRAFRIGVALAPGLRRQALGLVEERYEWRGYRHSGILQSGSHRVTLIAVEEDHGTVGTLTVGMDSPDGLFAEENYSDEIGSIRSVGGRVCEVNGFAVGEGVRSKKVLAGLFHAATLCARGLFGQTDCVIEVTPAHARFYRRMLGFRQVGEARVCSRVDTVGVLMHLDLSGLQSRIDGMGGQDDRASGDRSLLPYFFGQSEGQEVLERLRQALLPSDRIRTGLLPVVARRSPGLSGVRTSPFWPSGAFSLFLPLPSAPV